MMPKSRFFVRFSHQFETEVLWKHIVLPVNKYYNQN